METIATYKAEIPRLLQNIYIDALIGHEANVQEGLKQFKAKLEISNFATACLELRLAGTIDSYAIIFQVLDTIESFTYPAMVMRLLRIK